MLTECVFVVWSCIGMCVCVCGGGGGGRVCVWGGGGGVGSREYK